VWGNQTGDPRQLRGPFLVVAVLFATVARPVRVGGAREREWNLNSIIHSLIGVPFAVFWRKSGNLVVPAFAHALIDALRTALRLMG
jgi:membrane protease YdiL (CAAX protease family)